MNKVLTGGPLKHAFSSILEKKTFLFRKSAPYRVADPIGGILTILRKIFAPYRVGGLYTKVVWIDSPLLRI